MVYLICGFYGTVQVMSCELCRYSSNSSELGFNRSSYSAHHKSHIGKVTAHCTVGYCFDNNVEMEAMVF
jgi:hypothetical protein